MFLFKKIKISLIIISCLLSGGIWAASELGLKNKTSYYYVYTGNSTSKANCKGECYSVLSKDSEQWVQLASKNAWLDIQYNVCEGIDYSNPDPCDRYLGHFGISFSEGITKVSSSIGGVTSLDSYVVGKPFNVSFSPNKPVIFPTPSSYATLPYRGVNLTGGEFDYAFQLPDAESAVFFVKKGMNSIRLPFKWEYLQPASELGKPLDFTQGNAKAYADLVKQLTDAKVFVIIDMHNYMRYESKIIGVDKSVTKENYASVWGDFAKQFKDNKYVFFDLMNEPHDMSTNNIIKNYNAAILAIRAQGFNNLILLEGNNWSSLESWMQGGSESNSIAFLPGNIQDPLNHFAVNIHQYFDENGGNTRVCYSPDSILQKFSFDKFVTWLHQNNMNAFLTETGGAENENCARAINALISAVEANPSENNGGFLGWNAWDGGRNADNAAYRKNDLFYLGDVDTLDKIQMQKGFALHLQPTK